ncbi:21 kDa protein-like [Tasmannia lanceolata]|uniref:21 kDa protein-like n=1 Tax=Tasmannia lanceolata TaxID=3420 RepID=UPI004064C2B6
MTVFQWPSPFLSAVLSAFLLFPALIGAAPAPGPSVTGNNDPTEFIRKSCPTTLYPEICYTTLVGHANSVHQNPGRLAVAAVSVSVKKAKHAAVYFSSLSRNSGGGDASADAALHDCISMFSDAIDLMSGSKAELQVGKQGQISNVETLMSAALTNMETCMNGFEEVPSGPLKSDVSNRAAYVKKVTGNALSLVTGFATKV